MTDSVPLQWCWAVNHSNSYPHEHTHKLETLKIKKKKGNTWYKMIKKTTIMLIKAKWQQEQQQQLELLDKAPAL